MRKSEIVGIAAALLSLAACSDQSVTGIMPSNLSPRLLVAPTASGGAVCSNVGTGIVQTTINLGWAAAVPGSQWVGKTATASTIGRPRLGNDVYTSTFSVPAGATNISISGKVLADNDVVITAGGPTIYSSFVSVNGPRTPGSYTAQYPNTADTRTNPGFQTVEGLAFGAASGFGAGVDNTITFTVYNDDDPNATFDQTNVNNPSGLSFCYTVTYTPPVVQNGYWCSPGYWKNARDPAWNVFPAGLATRNTLYNSVISSPVVAANPTIWTVLNNPSTYKGPATNAVANYLAGLAGWTGTQASGDNCPLNNHGQFK